MYFGKWSFLPLKSLIKGSYTLNEKPLLFTGRSSMQFFSFTPPPPHPSPPQPFPNTVSQDTFGTLLLTVQYFGDLRDAIPCHCSPSTSHPALPREAEDFPAGGKYPKDGPLPTFLACLQSV